MEKDGEIAVLSDEECNEAINNKTMNNEKEWVSKLRRKVFVCEVEITSLTQNNWQELVDVPFCNIWLQ